ncbi:RING finger protein 145-like [Mytilus trossulus]|uniref:RING finger protein 145-like n=1 Tax=Mytilus trossulus TaxID=6551 RepID=UPI003006B0EF
MLRNINWENIIALSIRVLFLGFLDIIFRFSYQYLGWISYIVRSLGFLTLWVVYGLPNSSLQPVFRIMLGTSNIVIAWVVESLFLKCGETPGYPVHILIILKLLHITLVLFYYWFNKVNTLYRFAVYIYLFFIGGTVLQISPDWIFNTLIIVTILCLVLLCFCDVERHINLCSQRFEELEFDDININYRKEFSIYSIVLCTVCLINNCLVVDLDQNINKTKLVLYTTLGMCCCSVISVIAFSTFLIDIFKQLLKFCYFTVKGRYECTQEEFGFHILYTITVFLCTIGMISYDMEPLDRGIFLSSRIVYLAALSLQFCLALVEKASMDMAAMQASGYSTLRVIGMHIAFSIGPATILYGLLVKYSMDDLGILLSTSNFVFIFIKTITSLFVFCLYKLDETRQEFWENFDDVIFYARMSAATIQIGIQMATACVGIWTVFYGFYTWFDLYRLLVMCLFIIFLETIIFYYTMQLRKKVMAYTTDLEDASVSQLNRNDCRICFEDMMKGKVTRCGHSYHEKCLRKWLNTRMVCPLCNTPIVIQ